MDGEEIARRRARIGAELGARKLDALAVSFGPNLRYLTGFTGSHGLLLVMPDHAILYTDPRYTIQAAQEVSCQVVVCKGPLAFQLMAAADRWSVRRLGFEPARMTVAEYETMRNRLPRRMTLAPVADWIEEHRMIKSAAEIALVRRSVETNSRAFEQAVGHAGAGTREAGLAAELEYRMRREGAEKPAFETIVAAGARSALPHAQPTSARLGSHGLVLIDMGAFENGYASDMTRMLHVGRPGAEVKRMYRAVKAAQQAALEAVRPGVAAGHIDRVARRVLKAAGFDGAFVHSTGHGLGLEIHEPPRLGKNEKTRLREGMTITIEPGIYFENLGGIRIEDTAVVTRAGCEVLTPTSKELRVV